MKNIWSIIVPAAIIIGLMVAGYFIISGMKSEIKEPIGSVQRGGEYHATSTADMEGGAAFGSQIRRQLASTTPIGSAIVGDESLPAPILGSVIIKSSTPYSLTIRNATSTTDKASTTVAILDNADGNVTVGTYVFDLIMDRGIALDFESGFDGSYIITWR